MCSEAKDASYFLLDLMELLGVLVLTIKYLRIFQCIVQDLGMYFELLGQDD